MTLFAEKFTRKYSLSKTLRFELKPVGKTKNLLDDFGNSILAVDEERAVEYKKVKKILDDYYRDFIEEVLARDILSEKEMENAFIIFVKHMNDGIAFKKVQESLRNTISKEFEKQKKEHQLDAYEKLFKNDGKSKLYAWVEQRKVSGLLTEEKCNEIKKSLEQFNKFTTYFVGFKENRENLFVGKEQSTAISYRIVNENMVRFFENCERFEYIKDKYKKLYKMLMDTERYFSPKSFAHMLSQDNIDIYNSIVGRAVNSIDEKGVNSLINEYRQQQHIRNKDLPMMVQLYKQLLSDQEKSFVIEQLTSDEEMVEKAVSCCGDTQKLSAELAVLIKEYVTVDNSERLYLRGANLNNLSSLFYGSWDVINNAVYNKIESLKTKKQKEDFEKKVKTAISISELDALLEVYFNELDNIDKHELASKPLISELLCEHIPVIDYSPVMNDLSCCDREEKISKIKLVFDQIIEMLHYYKSFSLYEGTKVIEIAEKDTFFYGEFDGLFGDLSIASKVYDIIRNYVTKKPYSAEKIKINFNGPTLLKGWDINKECDNLSILLEKDHLFYLGIMDVEYRKSFDLMDEDVRKIALNDNEDRYYEKIEYKQISGASKMLPKVFFSKRHIDYYQPSKEILHIREMGLHKKEANDRQSVFKWIDFCKNSIEKHKEWMNYFKFKFKPTHEYDTVNSFYKDVENQAYSIKKVNISNSYIEQLVSEGKLYLFQIYNKDFSSYSKGRPNLHTLYWRMLFSNENLINIMANSELPIIKLNGEAEIFFRVKSLENNITHPRNIPIENKNPDNSKKHSIFKYDLIKNKRYTESKLFFHCPITINFRAADNPLYFNNKVNDFVAGNPDINIIGIDRGERHLLYFVVINQRGEILKQGSLNHVQDSYISNGKEVPINTDYRGLLDIKEKERNEARKNWTAIENIKELKAGYLSQVVHKLAEMMIEYNAVVILENLNSGFKRGRIKVEKQVYQNFEKALIAKLNYLVFKNKNNSEPGGVLQGYQLTAPFESFRNMGNQSGVLYYVYPSYTSHICPKTGFVDLLKPRYESVKESKDFFSKFEYIRFNSEKEYFEFSLDYTKFDKEMYRNEWLICTYGKERYGYERTSRLYKRYDVTSEITTLLDKNNIEYVDGRNIRKDICMSDDKAFFKSLLYFLGLTLQMRNTNGGTEDENDYILSPVQDKDGNFFDSRMASDKEPKNADANGAYHIALKGLRIIGTIADGRLGNPKGENQAWFKFAQEKTYWK